MAKKYLLYLAGNHRPIDNRWSLGKNSSVWGWLSWLKRTVWGAGRRLTSRTPRRWRSRTDGQPSRVRVVVVGPRCSGSVRP